MAHFALAAAVENLPALRAHDEVLDRTCRIGLFTQLFDLSFSVHPHVRNHAKYRAWVLAQAPFQLLFHLGTQSPRLSIQGADRTATRTQPVTAASFRT